MSMLRAAVLIALGGGMVMALPGQAVWLVILGVPLLAAPLFLLLAAGAAQRQELRLMRLAPEGRLRRLLGGPFLRLVVAAVLAGGITALALVRLAGQQQAALAALVGGAAGFVLARWVLGRMLATELNPAYRAVTLAGWAAALGTGFGLIALWIAGLWWSPAPAAPGTAVSALVAEGLRWQALALRIDAGVVEALGRAGTGGWPAVLWAALTQGAGVGWVCGTLAACTLPWAELARGWRPVGGASATSSVLGLVVQSMTLALTLGVAWPQLVLNAEAGLLARGSLSLPLARLAPRTTDETLAARGARELPSVVVEQVVMEVERIGRDLFRPGTIDQIDRLPAPATGVAEAHANLISMTNRGFDAMVANVDPFLDGYYSLGAEYARILALAKGELEAELQSSLQQALMQGQPFAGYDGAVARLQAAVGADEARARALAGILEGARVTVPEGVLPRIVAQRESLEGLAAAVDLSRLLQATRERGLASAGGGAAVVAAVVVRRVAVGNVLRIAATKLAQAVATRTVGGLAGFFGGAVIGGGAGSVVPGVGTAAGALIGGIAGGLAVTVSIDVIAVKIQEAMLRDEFHAQLVAEIEVLRADTLAALALPPG
ncbi:MAG: hypothetical protein ACK4GO_08695 [Gemmobacter sp.]